MDLSKSLSVAAFVLCVFSGNSFAADVEGGVFYGNAEGTNPVEIQGAPLNISISESDLKKIEKRSKSKNQSGSIDIMAGATGVQYFEVYAVGSSNVGWEYLNASQGSTSYNHGGSILYVSVLQYGYGNPNQSTMNGISKSYFDSDLLCGTLSNLHYCSVGETVTGWLYHYNFSGQQSGSFNASTNSTASPYGYWSDSVYIQ